MQTWKLNLTLQEPFACANRPVVSNEIGTTDYIPATVLRGAIASWLCFSGRTTEIEDWLGFGGGLRYAPAWWTPEGVTLVPMPLSFVRDKGDEGFGGRGVANTLWNEPPREENGHPLQWTRMGGGALWLALNSDFQPVGVRRLEPATSMHVALHYGRQSSREGALFSSAMISAGTQLTTWILAPGDLPKNPPEMLFLGRRRNAGNGKASVQVSDGGPALPFHGGLDVYETEAVVQILSDAIVADAFGNQLRGLDAEAWGALLGLPGKIKVPGAASTFRDVLGWSDTWGLPREPGIAVAAGSCYRIEADGVSQKKFSQALALLAENGIGLRRNEGFGIVAVNPPWLDCGREEQLFGGALKGSTKAPRGCAGKPLNWPGAGALSRSRLRELTRNAERLAAEPSLKHEQQKLTAIAVYSRRFDTIRTIGYVSALAHRPNPHKWDSLWKCLEADLRACETDDELRFLTEAVASLLDKEN